MKRVYITGEKGFIATHLRKELTSNGYVVIGGDIENFDYRYPEIAANEFNLHKPDIVIHNAAKVGRIFGEDDISYTIEENALMSARVAQACGEQGIPVLYLSTSEVYGDQGELDCYEGGPMQTPHNLYGLSKRWGEEVMALYATAGYQIIRLSMPFGPGLPAGRGRAAIINFLYNALNNQEIIVHKNSERSWCWVGDTVKGIRTIIEKGDICYHLEDYTKCKSIYNVGRSDNLISMRKVAEIACDLVGASYDLITMVEAPKNQTKVKNLSTKKLEKLGWKPEVDLIDGMKITLETIKKTEYSQSVIL